MAVTPTERMKARAAAIAAAVRQARERRDLSLREAARRAGVSPTTLSRLEDFNRVETPQVETLEALAVALDCPLYELLGESVTIEYGGAADWPAALSGVLARRGGFVTPAEHAFIQATLDEWRTGQQDEDDVYLEDKGFWENRLGAFRASRRWRLVEKLIAAGGLLDGQPRLLTALESVLALGFRGLEQQPEPKKKKKKKKKTRRNRKTKGGQ